METKGDKKIKFERKAKKCKLKKFRITSSLKTNEECLNLTPVYILNIRTSLEEIISHFFNKGIIFRYRQRNVIFIIVSFCLRNWITWFTNRPPLKWTQVIWQNKLRCIVSYSTLQLDRTMYIIETVETERELTFVGSVSNLEP